MKTFRNGLRSFPLVGSSGFYEKKPGTQGADDRPLTLHREDYKVYAIDGVIYATHAKAAPQLQKTAFQQTIARMHPFYLSRNRAEA
jgi:hypothetical protein